MIGNEQLITIIKILKRTFNQITIKPSAKTTTLAKQTMTACCLAYKWWGIADLLLYPVAPSSYYLCQ